MRGWWIAILLAGACSKSEQLTTSGRHVLVDIPAYGSCESHCSRARRAGERLVRCDQNPSGWELNPRFKGDSSPMQEPEAFDMAKRFGPLPKGYAFCSFTTVPE